MKILYFAWIRERLNRGEEIVDPPGSVSTVGDLIDWLGSRDEAARLALADRKAVRVAVNEELVDHDALLAGADTVALFPPMTGG
ncbi:MAG TPA: molybdopterin converting factor subunit 1 [Devosiaceae bacterium]|nr:molybdopterin converting factor subunit 1 [Devosiaceae bacterium]